MRLFTLWSVVAVTPALALSVTAHAQERQWSGAVAIGGGVKPDYQGSGDMEATPYFEGRVNYGPYALEFQGLNLKLNLSPIEGWSFGPAIDMESKRDDKVKSVAVGKMAEIDDALEAGGFIGYSRGDVFSKNDKLGAELSYMTDTSDTYGGAYGEAKLIYGKRINDRWSVGSSVKATYVDKKYAQTYFGVSAADALASGLPAYNLKSGVRDVSLGVKATYQLNDRWSVMALGSYKRLLGDFADSPIVKIEGSADQLLVGAAIGYRF
jgi:outer membrane scaffolding protein for murein synthesis (MipA/OmpV family)